MSVVISSENNPDHPIIKALHDRGAIELFIVYSPYWSTDWGWTILQGRKILFLIGDGLWLGYNKKMALKRINKIEIK